jgi:PAS domain S-box-containing protein
MLLFVFPAGAREREVERRQIEAERLDRIALFAHGLLEGTLAALPSALGAAREILGSQALGLYRISPSEPDYILEGALPPAFPARLPTTAQKQLDRPTTWLHGQRSEAPLAKAARAAGWTALRTSPLGTTEAWVGVLVAGWKAEEEVPADAATLMAILAELCHAAIQLGLQQASVAELGASLHRVEEQVAGLLSGINTAVLLLDGSLRVRRANPAASRILGYRAAEVEGLAVQDVLVGPEDILATLLDAQGHQRPSERSHITLHRREGTPFPALLRVLPSALAGENGLAIELVDETAMQAIEDQTEILAQRALLGEVTAIFAHEVRNPINNISTGVQLVASRLGEGHPLHESLDRVRKECVRLDQLMSDVLFFARPLELKIEALDLGELVNRLIQRWRPRLQQAGISVVTNFERGLPRARVDPRTLEQVIVNVITNAMQAMADGGTLSLSLAAAHGEGGRMVELKIADTGPGIPANLVDRIFDPFFTTKKDGTGLGLAISRRILTAHKGGIWVESYPGAGTVFTLHVPAEAAA